MGGCAGCASGAGCAWWLQPERAAKIAKARGAATRVFRIDMEFVSEKTGLVNAF
jgi:hypothetical protein